MKKNEELLTKSEMRTYRIVLGNEENLNENYKEFLNFFAENKKDSDIIIQIQSYHGEKSQYGFLPIVRGIISKIGEIFNKDVSSFLNHLIFHNLSNNEIIDVLQKLAIEISPNNLIIVILPILDTYQFDINYDLNNQIHWFVDLANLISSPIIISRNIHLPFINWKFLLPISEDLNFKIKSNSAFCQRYKEKNFSEKSYA